MLVMDLWFHDSVRHPGGGWWRREQRLEGNRSWEEKGQQTGAESLDPYQPDQSDDDGQDDHGFEFQGQQKRQHHLLQFGSGWNERENFKFRFKKFCDSSFFF